MSSTSAWVALGSGLLLLFLLHACQLPSDAVLRGTVVGVHDGDTLTLLTADRRQVKIRLAGIDAPERRQPYGQRSRQQLADLVSGREVQAQVAGVDKYQRTVARVHVKALDVNRELVRRGAAWVYRDYNRDASLLAAESAARRDGAGLWALPEAQRQPPWEWRPQQAAQRGASAARRTPDPACPPAATCSQLRSCAEAQRLLATCGLQALDRDRDGIPCEALCLD